MQEVNQVTLYNFKTNKEELWDFDVCVEYMDDEIREDIHDSQLAKSDQEFLNIYTHFHFAKFKEEFTFN